MEDVTRETHKRDAKRTDERAHVIYKIADGRDYCREDAPLNVRTLKAAKTWAESQYVPRVVTAYAIEWW